MGYFQPCSTIHLFLPVSICFFIHFYLLFLSILSNSANYDHHISVFHTSHQGVNLLFQRPTSWWVSNPGRRPLLPGFVFFYHFLGFFIGFSGWLHSCHKNWEKCRKTATGLVKSDQVPQLSAARGLDNLTRCRVCSTDIYTAPMWGGQRLFYNVSNVVAVVTNMSYLGRLPNTKLLHSLDLTMMAISI